MRRLNRLFKRNVWLAYFLLLSVPTFAASPERSTPVSSSAPEVPVVTTETESIFPQGSLSLSQTHFTWGIDVGSSIDLGGHDQSTFDADVLFGYKNSVFRLLGVGVGIHRAFGTGDNFIPVYFALRTSFRKKPAPLFLSFDAGYSFNTINDSSMLGDISASLGLGINLAMKKRFQSHIIISYGFRHFSRRHKQSFNLDADNVSLARLAFGVNF